MCRESRGPSERGRIFDARTYTANYFIQTDAATFTGGPIAADGSIQISISSGSAIVYGTSTDNTTNDPAIQFVYGLYAIA